MGRRMRFSVHGPLVFLAAFALVGLGGCFLFNVPPTARIVADPITGLSPLHVDFDGSGSTDDDGTIESYEWDFGDGSDTKTGATTDHIFRTTDKTRTFTVTLTVEDNLGGTDTVRQTIEVQPAAGGATETGMPVATFTVDHLIGRAPLTVTFDATDSEAGTGSIFEYDWDFGDGDRGVGSAVAHTYTPDETTEFLVTLMVWNSEGDVDSAQKTVIVMVPDEAADQEDPTAVIDADDPIVLYNPWPENPSTQDPVLFEVTFDPRGSFADAGHTIEYYVWDFGDGSDWVVKTADLKQTHVYRLTMPTRTFVVRLFVYDDQGLEGVTPFNLTLTQPEEEDEEE